MAKPDVSAWVAEITAARGVVVSATMGYSKFADAITAAVAEARALGSTPEELQPVTDVLDAFRPEIQALAAAVAANPGQPGQPGQPAPPTEPTPDQMRRGNR